MNLYSTVFSGREVIFTLKISPFRKKNEELEEPQPKPLIERMVSKASGSQYLMYRPTVGLSIQSRKNQNIYAICPSHLIYQLAGIFYSVYQKLSEKDWYIASPDGSITIVSSEVAKMSKRMSLFRSVIEVRPTMLDVLNEGTVPGIMVIINRELCGTMLEYEVKAFIDMVNHMDISTYSLLVGLVDKVDQIDGKLDKLLRGLNIR